MKNKFDHKRFKAELKRKKWSYTKFADLLREHFPKASRQLVRQWAAGLNRPDIEHWYYISKILEKPLEFFMK